MLTHYAFKLADCQTYVKTLHQMHIHSPSLVLVPDTFLSGSEKPSNSRRSSGSSNLSSSLLVQYIEEEFPGVPIEPVARKYWNDVGGEQFFSSVDILI